MNVVDWKLDAQAAIAAPRIHHQWFPEMLGARAGDRRATSIDGLGKRGHKVQDVPAHRHRQPARAHRRRASRRPREPRSPSQPGRILSGTCRARRITQGPDRQPRRDRLPGDPRLPRAGSRTVAVLLGRRPRRRCTCAWPTRRSRSARRPRARATCASTRSSTRSRTHGRRRGPPRLRLPVRERRLRRGVRGGGRDVHRAAAGGDPRHGRQDRGARADAGGGRAGGARRQRRRTGSGFATAGRGQGGGARASATR